MAYATITFEHPEIGTVRKAPVGFSNSLFFLGGIVPLVRKDWKWLFIMLAALVLTSGISWFVFPFIYNKLHIKELIKKGYKVGFVEGSDIATLHRKLELNLPEK